MIESPWDLATAPAVPSTVELWALSLSPAAPVDLARVTDLRVHEVKADLTWLSPVLGDPQQFAARGWLATVSPVPSAQTYPVSWQAMAWVETAPGGGVLGWFETLNGNTLETPLNQVRLSGNLTVARYAPANG